MGTMCVPSFSWFCLLGLASAADTALAQNLPLKAPLAPATANWTGCCVDAGAGYGMWNQNHYAETFPALIAVTPGITTGGEVWLGRIGGGCDYQFAIPKLGNFVVGAFGDYDFAKLTGIYQEPTIGLIGSEAETGAWAVGGRVG